MEILDCIQVANHYIEPGYTQPEKGILLANWNDIHEEYADALEEEGYELEWEDEWLVAGSGGAVRTQPSSYCWQPSYRITEHGEILTIEDPASEWIEDSAITDYMQPMKCVPNHITDQDLIEEGYQLYDIDDEYENGMHPGQTDDPKEIATLLFTEHEASSVVFKLTEQSQFYIKFQAWYKS